jgi:hypothetical protein
MANRSSRLKLYRLPKRKGNPKCGGWGRDQTQAGGRAQPPAAGKFRFGCIPGGANGSQEGATGVKLTWLKL